MIRFDIIRDHDERAAGGSGDERMLTELELAAVRSAEPTPGAAELIAAARATGRTITIR